MFDVEVDVDEVDDDETEGEPKAPKKSWAFISPITGTKEAWFILVSNN